MNKRQRKKELKKYSDAQRGVVPWIREKGEEKNLKKISFRDVTKKRSHLR